MTIVNLNDYRRPAPPKPNGNKGISAENACQPATFRPASERLGVDNPPKPLQQAIDCIKCGGCHFTIITNGCAVCSTQGCGQVLDLDLMMWL